MTGSTNPHLDHLLKVGVLHKMAHNADLPQAVRAEAQHELDRYRAEGREILKKRQEDRYMPKKKQVPQKKDPWNTDHEDSDRRVFTHRGVMFAVADDREGMDGSSSIEVIAAAIDDALDNGHEDPDSIARWLVTSSFNHEPSKRVRYNSLLRAGDAVGAQMTRKLYNAYNELAEMASDPELSASEKREAKAEATGFAEALSIVFSPFSCEDDSDPRMVDWDMVDHLTELFETEQRHVRKERKGRPQ